MELIQKFRSITHNQPYWVAGMAGAYLMAPVLGKTLCREYKAFQGNVSGYCDNYPDACKYPKEANVPLSLVAVTASTSTLNAAVVFSDDAVVNTPIT